MNKIKRAIIMAAGNGKRLRPLTYSIPKPLISVNGKKMIETIIEALHANDIYEIYIVVGYLKEQFDYLKNINGIKLIENPYFNECNNVSSLYVARDYIEDAIILDGDQIIYNEKILFKDFDKSGYSAFWVDNDTKEWLLSVNNDDIVSCNRTGGKNGWQLCSISRWNKEDANKLKKHIEIEFLDKNNKEIYWDDVALFCYPNEYNLRIYKINKKDIIEIDNLEELKEIDDNYREIEV